METGRTNANSLPASLETEWVSFRPSAIHGMGGFARKDIPTGVRVIEYVGERIDKQESLRRCEQNNEFIFTLNETCDLDGNIPGNPARWINHSCAPNCEPEEEGGRMFIDARRDIKPGEELTYDYQLFVEERYTPALKRLYACACGSRKCRGNFLAEKD